MAQMTAAAAVVLVMLDMSTSAIMVHLTFTSRVKDFRNPVGTGQQDCG